MFSRPNVVVCRLVLAVELVLAGFLAAIHGVSPQISVRDSLSVEPAANAEGDTILSPEEERRLLATGEWEDDYQAGREWTLREDGTGTMVVHLNGVAAFMFGAKLTFEQTWQIEGDQIVMAVTGGEPRSKVDIVLKMEGTTSTQRIVDLTQDRFVVVDEKGQQFDWRRLPEREGDDESVIDGTE